MEVLNPRTKAAVIQIAKWQLGVIEYPVNSNKVKYNKWYYGRDVSGSAYPWCMAFVQWVFIQAGFSLFKTASCSALLAQYKKLSPKQVVTSNYRAGDILLFDFSGKRSKTEHTGICIGTSSDGKYVYSIDGNTGTTNEANGGAVMERSRAVGYVTCAIRPNYPD